MTRPGRPAWRAARWGTRLLALALLGAGGAAGLPGGAWAHGTWGHAFRLAGPIPADVTAPRLAVAASGTIAVAYSVYNEDSPAGARAYVVLRSAGGRVAAPRAVGGAQQVLDLTYSRSTLELLVGGSQRGQACCSQARVMAGFGRPHTVADGLAGFTLGRLLALGSGRLLAAVATERGVWTAQSGGDGRFGGSHRISSRVQSPWTLAAAILPSASTFVGFTAAGQQPGGPGPRAVMVAQGTVSAAPRVARTAFTVAGGHALDELALAPGQSRALAVWIESWSAAGGAYRAQPVVADLMAGSRPRAFANPSAVASGISAAGDGSGQNVVAWKACDGSCSVWAVFRRAGGRFGSASRLGSIDASQAPATALGAGGRAVVAWVDQGRVMAADRGLRDSRFSAPRGVPTSSLSHDLSLAVAPDGSLVGAWTEGTLNPSLVGASYRVQ